MEKINVKIITIVLMILLIATFVKPIISLAAADWSFSSELSEINDKVKIDGPGKDVQATKKIVTSIINIVKIVATGVAIIMLTVLAIKYMSAAPGDKADIKKHAVVYVVGAVVLFGAAGILQIIEAFASTNIK